MHRCRTIGWRGALAAAFLVAAWAPPSRAVNIVVDYSYDANNFFPVGGQARTALEAVASYYSGILTDTFSTVAKPLDYHSSIGSGIHYWDWSMNFSNPSTGVGVEIDNPTIAADEYRIYVGGRNIDGATLGIGGPGGYGYGYNNNGGTFYPSDGPAIDQITADFVEAVTTRGETNGFSKWGGAVTFDASGTTWHFNHTTPPVAGTNDFYSVAIHEMGHALGLGASDEWSNWAGGSHFAGPAATAEYGSNPPLEPLAPPMTKRGHWAQNTMSRVFGTNTPQQPALTPSINVGTRKHLTALDAAALVDIGWTVVPPTPPTYHPADFNKDGSVNAPDLTAWRNSFGSASGGDADGDNDVDGRDFLIWQRNLGATAAGASGVPEPTTAALAAWAALAWASRRRARRSSR